jgi:hypothetical protein
MFIKIKNLIIILSLIALANCFVPLTAQAAVCDPTTNNCVNNNSVSNTPPTASSVGSSDACKNTNTSVKLRKCLNQSPIVHDLQVIINVMSAGIGIVIIGAIIFGGIRYSAAGDNAQATAAAKQHIYNALIALVAFIFTFAFLQWLIPGGVFD